MIREKIMKEIIEALKTDGAYLDLRVDAILEAVRAELPKEKIIGFDLRNSARNKHYYDCGWNDVLKVVHTLLT